MWPFSPRKPAAAALASDPGTALVPAPSPVPTGMALPPPAGLVREVQDERRPVLKVFKQYPINSSLAIDNAIDMEHVLRSFENGQFYLASHFCDQLLRDDRISGILDTRAGAVLSSPLNIEPAGDTKRAKDIADKLSDAGNTLWDTMVPQATVSTMLRWGHLMNIAVAEILWEGSPSAWTPRLRLWHPQFVWWNWATFSYWINTGDGVFELPRVDERPNSDGKWIVWCPRGYLHGWMNALVRSLGKLFIMRGWDYRDWARYNEVFGAPTKKGVVPSGAEIGVKEQFKADLMASGADGVVIVERGKEGMKDAGFDYQIVESTSTTGWNSFLAMKKEIDADVAVRVLGQNLPSESKGGGLGDGKAKSFELVRGDKLNEDAEIAGCLRRQLLYWWCKFNFFPSDTPPEKILTPRPVYDVRAGEEEASQAAAMKALGDGISALKNAGAPLDVRTIVERAGYPMLSVEEEAAQKQAEVEKQRQAFAQRGGPGAPPAPGGPPSTPAAPGKPNVFPFKKNPAAAAAVKAAALRASLPMPYARVSFAGMKVAIENHAGSMRLWKSDDGTTVGSTKMLADYGYLEGHAGRDGDELDCYVGLDEDAPEVHVIHQLAAPDYVDDDEDKVHIGFPDAAAAKANFLAHRNDGDRAYGGMTSMPVAMFREKMNARTGSGKVRASADTAGAVQLRSGTAKRRASMYAETLANRATAEGAKVVRSEVIEALVAALGKATSPADLKARLEEIARDANHTKLSALVEKTRLLAHMAGRGEMVQDL